MIAGRVFMALGMTAALAAPAFASGQGVSYNILDSNGSLSDCQLAASVGFTNAGFKNTSTVKSKTGHSGAVFADIGAYQGVIICDTTHKAATITVVGPDQAKTTSLVTSLTNAFNP